MVSVGIKVLSFYLHPDSSKSLMNFEIRILARIHLHSSQAKGTERRAGAKFVSFIFHELKGAVY